MKPSLRIAAAMLVSAAAGGAAAESLVKELAPDSMEGVLGAAACVVSGDRTASCSARALAAGQPGGITDEHGFTMLMVDGRVLARSCAVGGRGRVRASGVRHDGGFAMSLYRLEEDCGHGWTTVDLPHTGTLASGPAGGDE